MVFVEMPAFTRFHPTYLTDEQLHLLQLFLLRSPDAGDVIQDTGGLRKVRWSDPRRKKGKRGGLRIIYAHIPELSQIWLFTIYDKGTADDLTQAQRDALRVALDRERKLSIAAHRRRRSR